MLRYFYLLSLIIYIDESACYGHDRSLRFKPKHFSKRLLKSENSNIGNDHVFKRRQGYGAQNENDLTQIDVASFIQKPDSYADDDRLLSQSYDFKSQPKRFTDYEDISKIMRNMNIMNDNPNTNLDKRPNSYSRMDYINYQDLDLTPKSENTNYPPIYHEPPKKRCHWKNTLKFPFFFHRDNIPLINILNGPKKKDHLFSTTAEPRKYYGNNILNLPQKGKKKRANKETNNLKHNKNEKTKAKNDKRGFSQLIHNSRQYYQNLMSTSYAKSKNDLKKSQCSIQANSVQETQSTKCISGDDKKISRKRKGSIHRKKINKKKIAVEENNGYSSSN
ncbi:uncharacterized protein LOC128674183 isoform X2 [Plodia interpunctella]|uniref:uncharacterized protein LOC128674183 isoform X2 n=1 Tax=Plodia interpunctella TaxID=58824 RepID=UPI002367B533|nr:uncharacterized protein LOC128674183 isoform X2 [Plodia interpunctella]